MAAGKPDRPTSGRCQNCGRFIAKSAGILCSRCLINASVDRKIAIPGGIESARVDEQFVRKLTDLGLNPRFLSRNETAAGNGRVRMTTVQLPGRATTFRPPAAPPLRVRPLRDSVFIQAHRTSAISRSEGPRSRPTYEPAERPRSVVFTPIPPVATQHRVTPSHGMPARRRSRLADTVLPGIWHGGGGAARWLWRVSGTAAQRLRNHPRATGKLIAIGLVVICGGAAVGGAVAVLSSLLMP